MRDLIDDIDRWRRAGRRDHEAFAVGLTCGGTVHLFVEPLDW